MMSVRTRMTTIAMATLPATIPMDHSCALAMRGTLEVVWHVHVSQLVCLFVCLANGTFSEGPLNHSELPDHPTGNQLIRVSYVLGHYGHLHGLHIIHLPHACQCCGCVGIRSMPE